ncbi:MAG: hypothetical protein HWN66_11295 [Candidatus Helarchaeota archaeon]|nr:hypothetical protein [Candidatus Helarchaeota archaeon]
MDWFEYFLSLGLVGLGRALDIGSTFYASRTLALESNLLAKKLGWKGILIFNIAVCFFFAIDFYIALVLFVVSALAASNNIEKAWVTQTVGEKEYSEIFKKWVKQAESRKLFFSNFGGGILFLSIGTLLMFLTTDLTGFFIGFGFSIFAFAVMFHRTLAFYKIRKENRKSKTIE